MESEGWRGSDVVHIIYPECSRTKLEKSKECKDLSQGLSLETVEEPRRESGVLWTRHVAVSSLWLTGDKSFLVKFHLWLCLLIWQKSAICERGGYQSLRNAWWHPELRVGFPMTSCLHLNFYLSQGWSGLGQQNLGLQTTGKRAKALLFHSCYMSRYKALKMGTVSWLALLKHWSSLSPVE